MERSKTLMNTNRLAPSAHSLPAPAIMVWIKNGLNMMDALFRITDSAARALQIQRPHIFYIKTTFFCVCVFFTEGDRDSLFSAWKISHHSPSHARTPQPKKYRTSRARVSRAFSIICLCAYTCWLVCRTNKLHVPPHPLIYKCCQIWIKWDLRWLRYK